MKKGLKELLYKNLKTYKKFHQFFKVRNKISRQKTKKKCYIIEVNETIWIGYVKRNIKIKNQEPSKCLL